MLAISGLCVPLSAQWLNYPTPGIPRTPDGKPNLSAPAPRTADGKPDLSGIWRGTGMGGYDRNIARDLSPNDIQPWAEALYQQRVRDMGEGRPARHLPARPCSLLSYCRPSSDYPNSGTDCASLSGQHQ